MPNHKSAEKRVRQNERRRGVNRNNRTKLRTSIKKFRSALKTGDAGQVGTLWTRMSHPTFFALLAAICALAALGLRLMDARARLVSPAPAPQADPG